ncbi:hypothetical protein PC116_g26169 [Phytophthora cactorum]|uniref:Uncharacterized protein n=1 Tax=Phytophthora cactorum TaxID=29920 RepID=A0A8T1JKZ6_9STRA|nr:hypothetical protein PC111_g21573 [Phytophthora cactorum]KAG2807309.1 hypothetical protein PC112_g17459 [Phytophthora cactorum]KAG2893252.1 hypothetical protein PC117_g23824 [Phytophthora cactorum]KAG2982210.1 hypothetical protein PC120_g24688 [Phytophthora cactorum]KAG2993477.1 hypothetical protein PC119_g18450 [Phytophthora cactorum]
MTPEEVIMEAARTGQVRCAEVLVKYFDHVRESLTNADWRPFQKSNRLDIAAVNGHLDVCIYWRMQFQGNTQMWWSFYLD